MKTEDRFVPADERCPHPERWHSLNGDAAEEEVATFMAGLVCALQPDLVVETGAGIGTVTVPMSRALRHGQLVAVDPDVVRLAKIAERIPPSNTYLVPENSLEFELESYEAPPAQVWFADSLYETRVPEVLRALSRGWLVRRSIVAFHDTRPGAGGHRISSGLSLREEITKELLLPGLMSAIDLPTPRGLTLCEVL